MWTVHDIGEASSARCVLGEDEKAKAEGLE